MREGADMSEELISFEDAHRLLHYDPDTGVFRWKQLRRGITPGKVVGNVQAPERHRISPRHRVFVSGKSYLAHRLAWFMYYGEWPEQEIDHRDGNGSNNSILNLRYATSTQNNLNTPLRSDNTSGAKGVVFDRRNGKWRAVATINKKAYSLGGYLTKAEAIQARDDFCAMTHGEFFKEATCYRS